ncbi:MAG: hypothetical protein M3464_14230 [Chloroflexota bacterium]|nr:hypothetical protein [Chloroflexota bacterium]
MLSLAGGAVLVDAIGIQAVFWLGDTLLALAGVLGLVLLGSFEFRRLAM